MTLQQQAYSKIDRMSEEGIKFFLDFIDKVDNLRIFAVNADAEQVSGNSANSNTEPLSVQEMATDARNDDFFEYVNTLSPEGISGLTKADKKKLFLQSGGRVNYDEDAYWKLREGSVL